MATFKECENNILNTLEFCKKETKELKKIYSKFFDFNDVFSSEQGGKTRLNRQSFNADNDEIQEKIVVLNGLLDKSIENISETVKDELQQKGHFNRSMLNSLIYDDSNFFELLEMDLDTKVIPNHEKRKLIEILESLTRIKNRVYNLKYFITMFDTSYMNKIINKLGMEDLINSKLIFEVIDTYGLQNEQVERFEYTLNNFRNSDEKTKTFISFNHFLEHHKRRTENYLYANTRYKITLDYENSIELKKDITVNKGFVENIISNFIEQSCIDLVKKELKKGKIQKFIDITISKVKSNIQISVKNNGFEIKNVHSLYLSDNENRYIIESRNLARMFSGKIEINSIHGEGMQYLLEFKV